MPNYVQNLFKVSGPKAKVAEFVAANRTEHIHILPDWHKDAGKEEKYTQQLDFGVAVPPELDNPKYRVYPDAEGHLGVEKEDERTDAEGRKHYFNWYDFNIENWGTKWNAGDCEAPEIEDCGDTATAVYNFTTAWSFPDGWFMKVVEKWPELTFNHYATEEDHQFYIVASGENGIGQIQELDYDEYFLDRDKWNDGMKSVIEDLGLNPEEYDLDAIFDGDLGCDYFYANIIEDIENPSNSDIEFDVYDEEGLKEALANYKK